MRMKIRGDRDFLGSRLPCADGGDFLGALAGAAELKAGVAARRPDAAVGIERAVGRIGERMNGRPRACTIASLPRRWCWPTASRSLRW